MSFRNIELTLADAVAQNGTIVFAYPAGTGLGSFAGFGHILVANGLQATFSQDDGGISVAFTTVVTVTYKGATSIPAGSVVRLQLNIAGDDNLEIPDLSTVSPKVAFVHPIIIDLGVPDAADANGIVESQNLTAAGAYSVGAFNGVYGVGGTHAILDMPRNVVAAWTGTAVLTVTGKDEYGNVMVESSASGTSFTGKKAFYRIDSIAVSADVTSITVGTGDVLGLPVYVPSGAILAEYEDGAAASAGTFVAGVQTTPTATTGDVRGTYDPNSACDGSKAFKLAVLLTDPTYKGVDQYAG